ncbi:hypothetical protein ACH5RR_036268 [Cinchona calisaya]|uniref:S-adenosylmethionine-dependent methyltransferase n=1 Tax=Cinchona calisaya TaxID=153742 RepID=A0ABD2Y6A1_9GENT
MNTIEEALEVSKHSQIFCIADLGCAVGPNTFSCVNTLIEAVQHKYKKNHSSDAKIPEFQVFFNDHVKNDFNTLFKRLPSDRQYMAAGVPGSFRGRIFPKSSMNLMHSAFALHWLTRVPQEVTRKDSPAWNKGNITYVRSSAPVIDAFEAQFFSEMMDFLKARSEELAPGGLLAIFMPCRTECTLPSETTVIHSFECLGDALAEMVKEDLVTEDLADSFNIPIFYPMASEVKELVSSNKHLSIERFEEIYLPPRLKTPEDIQFGSAHVRAAFEGILSEHFGHEIADELFNRYPEKLEKFSMTSEFTRVEKLEFLFMVAKRKDDC